MSTQTPHDTDNRDEVMASARQTLGDRLADFILSCRDAQRPGGRLIAVLHEIQHEYGYLSQERLQAAAYLLGVPAAAVTGVASFYHFFKFTKPGRFNISLCMGTACYVKGADRVAAKLHDELGIGFGQTTSDGLFSLEQARCLGMCGLAPVMMINDKTYENVTPEAIPALLAQCAKQAKG